ncbi:MULTISPECIES: NAD(P)H-dependent oxidoreductase [unclassified Rhizobium]|jgi:FMN-dependent NADH-azoreductase|uniref:FMN-dependent NADH-azoreductase n=1 Tax=unclassified Rhizobium TaxID=2613769 RepID=UPI000645BDFA|nr:MULTISPECIES: NAD(P)H-dependent oxidoreductase [unclassified Rhizobium]MBN8949111.1 NAD(P)H-dependent oxidoreductase [Rhizobium tropici]OJY65560.1 MAG: FMN-dependent NADH-azoreductase [Rhizobium sp. 60-20]RKD35788.1 FMN-dependent NADH-azoreductase [Rhizobium sp. WW_1]
MTNTLLVTSSPRGAEGLSTRFATEIAEGLKARSGGTITVRDLATEPLPHITPAYINGRIASPEARTAEQAEAVKLAETLVGEIRAADIIILGSSMINFGPSSLLKAWFDHIIWPGVTFGYGETGPIGLVPNKKVYLVTATGGVFSEGKYASFDFQTGYLRHLLGFIGLTDVELVRVEGTVLGPDVANAAIAATEAQVRAVLERAA